MKAKVAFALLLWVLPLFACSGSRSPGATPTPTAAADSSTLEPAGAFTPNTSPGAISSTGMEGTVNDILNVRSGPGLNYPVKSQLKQGDKITIMGKSPDGLWLQFSGGWVSATYVQLNVDPTVVPVNTPGSQPLD